MIIRRKPREKKALNSKLVIIAIGVILITGNAYELITGHLLPKRDPSSISQFVLIFESCLTNLSLFPVGLPAILSLFNKGGSIAYVYITIAAWQCFVLLCGIGLIAFKNFIRKSLIILCITRIILFLISWPITYVLYGRVEGKNSSFAFYDLITLMIPVIYIICLTRKEIKELFVKTDIGNS